MSASIVTAIKKDCAETQSFLFADLSIEGLLVGVDEFHNASSAVLGTENFLDLVLNELFDVRTAISAILTRIKVLRMSEEVLADTSRHSEAQIGVDVDLADCGLSGLAELVLRNADSIVELAAVLVDDLDVLRDNRGSAMENDRELRDLLLDLCEDVETELRRYENAVSIARALLRFELECAMGRADSDSQGINASLLDEFLNFFRLRVSCIMSSNLDVILDTSQFTQLSLDDYATCMSVLNDFLSDFDVLFEVIVGTVDHDGGETTINAGFASLEICAVVEMQSDRNIVDLQSSFYEMHEVLMLSVFTCASGALQDDRGLQLSSCFRDTLYDFHVVDVESTDSVAAFVSFLEHFFRSN